MLIIIRARMTEQGDEPGGGVDRVTRAAGRRPLRRNSRALASPGQSARRRPRRSLGRRILGHPDGHRHVGQGPHLAFAADGCRNGLGPDGATHTFALPSIAQAVAGLAAGFAIVTAVMGFAGGELLIPTIVLLYGIDTKLAGSISLAVSLPTMILAFARYSRDTRLSPSSTATNDSG
jgi:hypothetical protein